MERVLPYLGVAPGLVVDDVSLQTTLQGRNDMAGDTVPRFSFEGFVGAELRATRDGRFFLEAGYRGSPTESRAWGDSHLSTLLVVVGWTFALSLYGGAYMVEAVRSGIQSIWKHQWEAARALSLGYWRTMAHIVAPQAIRVTLPAAIGIFISLLKGSSVASIIGFVELLQTAINIRNSIFSLSPLFVAGVLYFLMCYGLSRFGGRVEGRFRYGAS